MSQDPQKNDYRALLQQALVSLEQMERKLNAAEQVRYEPIAIIGMGFRFPGGADDRQAFWQLLLEGTDAITEVPSNRWNAEHFFDPDPDAVGKMYTRWGGFLKNVDKFDPQFFGISPREAVSMDPQQRLLLETTWEALENAGQAGSGLAGSRTGVFVGMVGSDYANLKMISGGINHVDAYFGTGISRSIAAGRIAYTFGLHGPAVTIDTACSSSLVAVHQACQSLRLKESDMAMAGGVNMILEPSGSISTSRARMMSFDGRCKTFDATADGYVRSEGCAMIVLKRLSDALANGDSILAVIKGTAVNQDGRSNGLTAPNGKAQEAVIRAALDDAQLKPGDISFVETHGTGTSLGDPIEVRALGAVFNEGHDVQNPLMIGSVKTNVGHLEAAAGIVGLVKVVLALQNKIIPPHIHLDELNPFIPWSELPLAVPIKPTAWTSPAGKPRSAGLSSFGFSGTNAHMIISEAPEQPVQQAKYERASQLVALSAKTEAALRELAGKIEHYFQLNSSMPITDIAYTLNNGRSHFTQRLAFSSNSLLDAQEKISSWLRDGESSGVYSRAVTESGIPEVVFLFTGQGSQYVEMARQLYESQPTFRKVMEQCDELLRPYLGESLLSVIYPRRKADEDKIHQTSYTQPALFVVEYSLAKLWQSWGVNPAVVMGHSVGEYVAACIAGVFSLEDGLKLIAERGRLMQSLSENGVMYSVFAEEKRVRDAISAYPNELSIAAVNGPDVVVISGRKPVVELIVDNLRKEGIKSQKLNVSHAFHSPLIDSVLDDFERVANSILYHPPQIGVVSNVSGKLIVEDGVFSPGYWRNQTRQAVRFADEIHTLRAEGYRYFLEIGPNPTLLGMARRCEPITPDSIWLPSLRAGRNDWDQMLESLAQLYAAGLDVNWENFENGYKHQRKHLELPTYPFQRESYWLDLEDSNVSFETKTDHPLLGARLATAAPVFQKRLSASNPAYLADHSIHKTIILPAAAYTEIAFAAAINALGVGPYILEDLSIHEALPLSQNSDSVAQIVLNPDLDGASFQYFSFDNSGIQKPWRLHANGRIRRQQIEDVANTLSLDEAQARLSQSMPVDAYYEHLSAVGADYGPAFRAIVEIWCADGEALGKITLPQALVTEEYKRYLIHPSILDGCFQLIGAAVLGATDLDRAENNIIYVPIGIREMRIFKSPEHSVFCHIKLNETEQPRSKILSGDLIIYDISGSIVATVNGLQLQQINQQALQRALQTNVDNWLYELDWPEVTVGQPRNLWNEPGSWLIFADEKGVAQSLEARLKEKGEQCYLVYPGNDFVRKDPGQWVVNPLQIEDFKHLLMDIKADQSLRGVVHLWSLNDEPDAHMDLETINSSQARNVGSALQLVKILEDFTKSSSRIWLVTSGAQATDENKTVNILASTLWGLGNVIALEHPNFHCTRIDLDPDNNEIDQLFLDIWNGDVEDQIAYRGRKRLVARLVHGRAKRQTHFENQPLVLSISERGVLDNLSLQSLLRRIPESNEVEIDVFATGLNFRDVLNTLGLYPGDAGPLGSECAGKITALGNNVKDLKIGDDVIALASNSFGSYVTVPAELVVRKPANLTFEEAATIPIAFLTADYALNVLAKMKMGDRVLIHAAAGGVGMAAIQLAQRAGAEIFGTAGSDEKRALLTSLGVQHVMNSRTLDFSDEIMSLTHGDGVDVVLNSLAGDFIPKSISVLRETGCFIEIGKTGVWDAKQAEKLKSSLVYHVLYLGEILDKKPQAIRERLLRLIDDFESGKLKPLPQTIFPIEKSIDAFRYMAQAKHTGKIIITQAKPEMRTAELRANATYLITGGLGGLGLVTARWFVDRGARYLVLMGRNAPSASVQREVDDLKAQGVDVRIANADVSQREQIEKVLRDIAVHMPPLHGIVHAAGLLDDGVLAEQSWSRFSTVMAPKVAGAWNLHALTLGMPLDFFILFSAGASLLGSAGQSNYASANAFLDGLAHYRRARGLPGLTINWGAWADVGMAAKLADKNQQRWRVQGMDLIKPAEGMRALERLLEWQMVQAGVLPINWKKAIREKDANVRPLLSVLVNSESRVGEHLSSNKHTFIEQLNKTPEEEQYKLLSQHIIGEVKKVLGLDASHAPSLRQGFTDIGLDSLMAVELSNRLQKTLGKRLPATLTFENPTIEALTNYLATDVLGITKPDMVNKPLQETEKQPQSVNSDIEKISDDKLEDALLKELKDAGY